MALNLGQIVINFLKEHPGQKFTAKEIAEWIFKHHTTECKEKQQRSTATKIPLDSDSALIQQITAEIGSHRRSIQKKYPNIKTTESRPREYFYTKDNDSNLINNPLTNIDLINAMRHPDYRTKEEDLYPRLANYLESEFELHCKRIDDKRSSNKNGTNGNKWLYPDVVAVQNLSSNWNDEIKQCVKFFNNNEIKLWSFEVKLALNRSNVREAFFQAVSNSSWANLGYLVASEIHGDNTIKELQILSQLHGIGIILLNTDNPAESEIILQAKERQHIDWDTANRIAEENKDFIEYIKLIRHFYQTGEIRQKDWGVPTIFKMAVFSLDLI